MARKKTDAAFVFEGSVVKTAASNVNAVPSSKSTVVVQVDHVRSAPRALAGMAGRQVTLQVSPGEKLKSGQSALFYADGLVFGENVALQSLGHDPLQTSESRAAMAAASPVVNRLSARISQADAVVSGKVESVKPAIEPAVAAGSPREFISEHAPLWHDALINVTEAYKGISGKKKVVVRFPMSTDVKWRRSPRFETGQKGTWLLHDSPVTAPLSVAAMESVPARLAAKPSRKEKAADVYYSPTQVDFHPESESALVSTLLPDAGSGRPAKKAPASKRAKSKKAVKR